MTPARITRWYDRGIMRYGMYEAFNSQSKSIGGLLGGNERAKIVVPRFQRGYSWVKKHVTAFWKDVTDFQDESKGANGPDKYFLGPIVIMPRSRDEIDLLDGQQRLATATILLSVMRDTARDLKFQGAGDFARDIQRELVEKGDGFALQLGEMDRSYFQTTIQDDPPKDKTPSIRSHRNIRTARKNLKAALDKHLSGLDPQASLKEIKALYQIIRSDLVMASIPVSSERAAFRIFETLNDRGLRLSVPDLLLNYLMRSADDDSKRAQIRVFWNEMLEQMGRRDINRFLRHMWVSKYGDLKKQDLFTALKEHIEGAGVESLEFTSTCAEECESYTHLVDYNAAQLRKSAPYVRTLVAQLDIQAALPVLLSGYRSLGPVDFTKLVKWLLVFVTRYSLISQLDSSGLETILFDLAKDIRKQMAAGKKATKQCLKHIKDTLVDGAPSDEQLKAAFAELVLGSDEARYILSRLAERMQTDTKEVSLNEANLEHIFPKNPDSKEWKKQERDKLEPLLWHIGNLTMLGERLNRSIANKGFKKKRQYYAKASELEMAKRLAKEHTTWTEKDITGRAKRLVPLVTEVWNFSNPSRV